MIEDSLKKRYLYKLTGNLVWSCVALVTAGIVPRALGPASYGNFNFLTNFFIQVVNFFDMGTATAFYIKLSQRTNDYKLIAFYLYFSILITVFTFLLVAGSYFLKIENILWPGQEGLFIWAAAILGVLNWFSNHVMNRIMDAYGMTIAGEKIVILQRILSLLLLLIIFFSGFLGLKEYFLYQYVIIALLCIAWWGVLTQNGIYLFQKFRLTCLEIISYSKEFFNYTYPLFIYTLAGFITAILDRWLLQIYGGSIQQGFFGLSSQIGVLCFLFTNSMTPLLMREFSIAFVNKDINQIAFLFRRYIPLMYSITAFFSCFIAMQADKVVSIFGGSHFRDAVMVVIIMAFFPIHQTYGQLSSSVFYATGQIKLYRNIGIIFMIIGFPITYFLIAPKEQWGIGIGAAGLAIKTVVLQFIAVNVQLYFNSRFLELSFWKYFGHQIFSVGCFLAVATVAILGVDNILGIRENIINGFLLAGVFYTLIVIGLIYCLPVIAGLKRQDIQTAMHFVFKKGRGVSLP